MSSCFFFIITCRRYCFWNPIACTFFITVRHAVEVLFNIFWTIFMQSQFSGLSDRARENTSNVINRIFSGLSDRARKHSCDYYLSRNIYYWSYIHLKSMDGASNDACAFARLDCWMLPSGKYFHRGINLHINYILLTIMQQIVYYRISIPNDRW